MNKLTGATNESMQVSAELDRVYDSIIQKSSPVPSLICKIVQIAEDIGLPLQEEDLHQQLNELRHQIPGQMQSLQHKDSINQQIVNLDAQIKRQ